MERDKLSAITMIAVILGAIGLGVGAYSIFTIQTGGADGDDGDDGDDGAIGQKGDKGDEEFYYCSSETELQNAIDTIGPGSGIIMITDNITLSATIDVNGGGSYIIQGFGLNIVECPVNAFAFDITNAHSCIIRDLIIDSSKITNGFAAIWIDETNDNPILIDNLRIFSGYARGIQIVSENVTVRNSNFYDLWMGISVHEKYATIYDNKLVNSSYYGIYLDAISDGAIVYNNYIKGSEFAIILEPSHFSTISYNIITRFDKQGIGLTDGSSFNEIIGNQISNSLTYDFGGNNRSCIGFYGNAYYNRVIGNFCYNCTNVSSTQYGLGIWITSNGENNLISGNTCIYNEDNIGDYGINNDLVGNNAP